MYKSGKPDKMNKPMKSGAPKPQKMVKPLKKAASPAMRKNRNSDTMRKTRGM